MPSEFPPDSSDVAVLPFRRSSVITAVAALVLVGLCGGAALLISPERFDFMNLPILVRQGLGLGMVYYTFRAFLRLRSPGWPSEAARLTNNTLKVTTSIWEATEVRLGELADIALVKGAIRVTVTDGSGRMITHEIPKLMVGAGSAEGQRSAEEFIRLVRARAGLDQGSPEG